MPTTPFSKNLFFKNSFVHFNLNPPSHMPSLPQSFFHAYMHKITKLGLKLKIHKKSMHLKIVLQVFFHVAPMLCKLLNLLPKRRVCTLSFANFMDIFIEYYFGLNGNQFLSNQIPRYIFQAFKKIKFILHLNCLEQCYIIPSSFMILFEIAMKGISKHYMLNQPIILIDLWGKLCK